MWEPIPLRNDRAIAKVIGFFAGSATGFEDAVSIGIAKEAETVHTLPLLRAFAHTSSRSFEGT